MTESYAKSLAIDAMARLSGVEKRLMQGDSIVITVNPDGRNTVKAYSPTVSGATVEHIFYSDVTGVLYGGTQMQNVYGVA